MELVTIKTLWGNSSFNYALSYSLGNSKGILCVWKPTLFVKDNSTSYDNFLAVMSTWVPSSSKLLIISVNASQDLTEKRVLWDYILPLIDRWDGDAMIMGDFNKTANKMSKLDRFLVSKGLLASFPYLLALCLDRNLSDHHPILMRELSIDYGPTPFRFFHSWFNLDGFDKMVEDTWKSLATVDSNGMINLKKKLQALKIVIKQWTKNAKKSSYKAKISIQSKLFDIDQIFDQGGIRWAIEGDENTKFFHGILNSKRSQLAIRGTPVDGEWIVDPLAVKSVFLKYFSTQFSSPVSPRICFADQFTNRLSLEQQADLERNVSNEEIKSAVWDCGTRCNSSFIALIPKIHDAKVIKDYRPISLIGSLYKIIAKILANRLSFVISGLISDVQSAFVSNRQILDGPFILNEILSWYKHKKFKGMVFKVDFKKAFDSIRWDYLQDILKMFGFGDKWCGWINGYLNSTMGLILINESPTSEFQFHKGLFSDIPIDSSLTLSHLFFADDAIFIGK
ncbi:RNA-directed DNA polymerase, eukaryota [Tanacetum coccineum]